MYRVVGHGFCGGEGVYRFSFANASAIAVFAGFSWRCCGRNAGGETLMDVVARCRSSMFYRKTFVLPRVHAAAQLVSAFPKGGVAFGFFECHGVSRVGYWTREIFRSGYGKAQG